jgi:hypothetical protein
MTQPNNPGNKPELFVDNEPYQWPQDSITGAQIRELASLPADVKLFMKVPGHPDKEIADGDIIQLDKHGAPKRFSSQAVGSQAG